MGDADEYRKLLEVSNRIGLCQIPIPNAMDHIAIALIYTQVYLREAAATVTGAGCKEDNCQTSLDSGHGRNLE